MEWSGKFSLLQIPSLDLCFLSNHKLKFMRKKIVAGNWKMNKTLPEGLQLADEILKQLTATDTEKATVIFCPPFISLSAVSEKIKGKEDIFSGAQNCHWQKSGAFTGEISADMIKSCGAEYVIIGHSERREFFEESEAVLSKKVDVALQAGLKLIFCVGESLEEREANVQEQLVQRQLEEGLFQLSKEDFSKVVIAYEPVWAIGTGKVASDAQAQEMHAFIRKVIFDKYGEEISEACLILYGGSCKPNNARGLFEQKDIDGGLIGGASLNATEFLGIIRAC